MKTRSRVARFGLFYYKMPLNGTPSPSEFEEFDDAYGEAWRFWVELNTSKVSHKRYHRTVNYFDSIPGVSEYFRNLCHFELTTQEDVFVIRRAY